MQLLKHRARGSDVTAVQATEENMAEVALEANGNVFTSPRTNERYALLETDEGSKRIQAGDYLVRHEQGEDVWFEVMTSDVFELTYERP